MGKTLSYILEAKDIFESGSTNIVKDYNWQKFMDKIEDATGFKVLSEYRTHYTPWIELVDDQGRIREAEITKYFDGGYELNVSNISSPITEEYSLVGQDGNAFALMGYTARCMKECGLRDEIEEMRKRATSGDYYNLIRVCDEYVQRCNEINPDLEESYISSSNKATEKSVNSVVINNIIKELKYTDYIPEEDAKKLKEAGITIYYKDNGDWVLQGKDPEMDMDWWNVQDILLDHDDQFNFYAALTWTYDDTINESLDFSDDELKLINIALETEIDRRESNNISKNLKEYNELLKKVSKERGITRQDESLNKFNENLQDTLDEIVDNYIIYKKRNNAGIMSVDEEGLEAFEEFSIKYPTLVKALKARVEDDFEKDLVKSNIGLAVKPIGLLDESLNEDTQKELFDKPGEFWYFTKHGIGPGAVPKVNIEKVVEKDGGEYFLIKDKILSTYALDKYDIKEKSPDDIDEELKEGYSPTWGSARSANKRAGILKFGEQQWYPLSENVHFSLGQCKGMFDFKKGEVITAFTFGISMFRDDAERLRIPIGERSCHFYGYTADELTALYNSIKDMSEEQLIEFIKECALNAEDKF